MNKLDRDDILNSLAFLPLLAVRLYADGGDAAGRRLALLVVVLLIAHGWAALFAYRAERPIGPGLIPHALLFVVLLPGPVPWGGAILAVSFGSVFGREIFGGKAILPPTLIALAFALFSFPRGGFEVLGLLSRPADPLFAISCLPGAALLAWHHGLAWRVAAGAVLGTAAAALLIGLPAWWTHLWMGTYAAGILFLAAVPEGSPKTEGARWLHGALVGALLVLIRFASPEQPDGVVFAALLGGLFAPLLDRLLIWRHRHALYPHS
ncbi:MAG TPA: RnfABCDGE type electron transport complex subunit D [Rhodospirillales bacterium]|jgi:Na+-transporting NADH:ubiquinone oxidoreductase subunit B|nr:RnfABCDGE type electron transport complex subunit D [Rhodospirillales bacterium]HJO68632.1 RnfABCDGE type electron transport complex subunit D [Rhodospirillales bacterium]